jgi:hypothetical protein
LGYYTKIVEDERMNVIQKEKQHQELEEEEEEEEEKNKVNRSNLNPSSTGATSNLCTRRLSMDHHKKDQETFPALFIWTQQLPLPSCCSVTISGSFNK